jgi:hypothetical protein
LRPNNSKLAQAEAYNAANRTTASNPAFASFGDILPDRAGDGFGVSAGLPDSAIRFLHWARRSGDNGLLASRSLHNL